MKQNLELFFAAVLVVVVVFYCCSEAVGFVSLYHCFMCVCWHMSNYMNITENRDFYYGRKDILM